ncbi:hypothetical protein CTI12_AA576270 [Artemisia annua]|uniref:Uncharacterized protein n=1 Tax=Artemisia annua TaxID=35608 RepID=A0A2U1KQG9_ARTAN|nr:hypothetical protein CTI12_AA576270 [Artemisia annua]
MAEGDVELGHVEIDKTFQLLLKYDGVEVQNPRDQRPGSIFMVPSVYRDLSPRSFTPRVVSIGPLHHQDKHLKGFEVQKATYMHNLFHNVLRSLDSTPEQILKECVMRVSGSIDQIKACYIGMQAYTDSELVKMMVTDACFILAFLYDDARGYSSLGPINLLITKILLDMVLIENQIPFFVFQDIFECTFSKLDPTLTLADFILVILNYCNIFPDSKIDNSNIFVTHDHILGFLHKSYQNPDRDSSGLDEYPKAHSVVELDRSGVRFSKKLDARWPMAMELEFSRFQCFPLKLSWSKPTLKMPVLLLVDNTELVIRNLIIYEQFAEVQTCVTSYMLALDHLIDNPADVAKLAKSQVIVNRLGSVEKATNLINNMLEEVIIKEFFYEDEWKLLDKYYNAKWPKFIAVLRRKYFSNPWSIVALIAGIALFVLTVVQTVFTVIQTVYAVKAVKDSKAA